MLCHLGDIGSILRLGGLFVLPLLIHCREGRFFPYLALRQLAPSLDNPSGLTTDINGSFAGAIAQAVQTHELQHDIIYLAFQVAARYYKQN